jgi:osmotically-inducible protein OsmY
VTTQADLLDRIRHAFRSEPRIRQAGAPIHLALSAGALVIEGEVEDVAAKKLALEAAARTAGQATGIVDRLRVRPQTPMGDGEIRDHLRDALLAEPVLADCTLRVIAPGPATLVREPPTPSGNIEIGVADGVVTLDGEVSGLGQKRMAGVLAWWVPGSRDVVNGLGVTPPETDSDDAITDAVKQVIEKDPFVTSAAIEAGTRNAVVRLLGSVPSENERRLAEADAWYVFGVDGVENRLDVQP